MAIYIVQLLILFVKIMLTPAQNGADLFQMTCKNIDTPINIVSGDSHQFYCSSNKKFESCKIERKTDRQTRFCVFKFDRGWVSPGQTPKPKELKRVGWDCLLDVDTLRIKVLEKTNQNVCHLQVDNFSSNGNSFIIISLVFIH